MARLDHAPPHFTPQGLRFRDEKSFATANSPILVGLFHLALVNLRLPSAAAFKDAGNAFEQRTSPLMYHWGVNAETACQLWYRLLVLPARPSP
jgi:hypothetical protein